MQLFKRLKCCLLFWAPFKLAIFFREAMVKADWQSHLNIRMNFL